MIERIEVDGAVILVGADAIEVGVAVQQAVAQGERVAAMIGSTDDPAVRAALDEMLDELFKPGDANS
jgi:tryptophan synthase alpha subunit